MIFNPFTQQWEEGSRPSYGYEGEFSAGTNWNPQYQLETLRREDPLLSRLTGMGVDLSGLNLGNDYLNDLAARYVNNVTAYPDDLLWGQIRTAAAGNPQATAEVDRAYAQAVQNFNNKQAEGPSWARKYLKPAILGGAGILTGMGLAQGLGLMGDGGMSVFGSDAAVAPASTGGGWVEGGGMLDFGTGLNAAAPSGASFAQTGMGSGFWEGLAGSGVAGPTGFFTAPAEALFPAAFGGAASGGLLSGLLGNIGASGASAAVKSLLGGNENSLLGALLGGALGSLDGSKQAGTTTTTQDPWWGQQPYLLDVFNRAAQTTNAATQSPVYGASQDELMKTIRGDYLTSNPYLDATYRMASDRVGADIDSRFAKAGRYGSGAQQRLLGDSLGNLATNIYGQNYQTERGRQAAATLAGPDFGGAMTDAAFRPLQNYSSLIRGSYGGSRTDPYFTNPMSGILGGALAGSQLLRSF